MAAAAFLSVGLIGFAGPADAVVSCTFAGGTLAVELEKREALTIARDGDGSLLITSNAGTVDCGTPVSVANVENVVIGVDANDNDEEQVTLDVADGGFIDPADPAG